MSHTRTVCPHDVVLSTCRCASPHKATEVVWPCPLPEKHAGYAVVHPIGPQDRDTRCPRCGRDTVRTDTFTSMAGTTRRQLCVAPGCGWVRQTEAGRSSYCAAELHDQCPQRPGAPEPRCGCPCHGTGEGADLPIVRAVKQCVFRSCDWTIEEPANLFALAAMDAEIRVHLRTHRPEIELMSRFIQ